MVPRAQRLQRVVRETRDTFTWTLDRADGARSFMPGQFNMLYLFGVGEIPISISGDPGEPGAMVHTIRAVGTVTNAMKQLRRGQAVGVRGPFGTGWPVEDATGKDVIVVAGGIGLAPLRPALYQLLAQRARFGRVVLLYGARSPAELLYRKQLERWRSRLDLHVAVTVDRSVDGWRGHVGVVTSLIPYVPFDAANAIAMICGPEIMMRFVALELQKRGMDPASVFVSLERNMHCAIGLCGHCMFGPSFICKDGPVFRYDRIQWLLGKREI